MALGALLTGNLSAATVTFAWGGVHSPNGGEFTATTSANGVFQTFCIEHNENIDFSSTYNYAISGGAIQGGLSGGNPDPISLGTAYLYSQFRAGTLGGYSSGNSADQNNLQNAFWMLEGELTYDGNNVYIAAAKTALSATDAQVQADGGGIYGVQAMNVTTLSGGIAQDQLILVPDGGMTLAMLGMACASFGLLRRKL